MAFLVAGTGVTYGVLKGYEALSAPANSKDLGACSINANHTAKPSFNYKSEKNTITLSSGKPVVIVSPAIGKI